MLIEKYRPKTLNEFINNKSDVIRFIENTINSNKSLPHLILYSKSPGTGKSSLIKAIATEYDADILYIDASKERGIDMIRHQVTEYVSSVGFNNSYRFVLFDEADGLTPDAFDALRNLMERVNEKVKFVFSCNNINAITDPIKSRCLSIDMSAPNKHEILKRLKYIASEESINVPEEELVKLIQNNYPDVRSMIVSLENFDTVGHLASNTDITVNLYSLIKNHKKRDACKLIYDRTLNHEAILKSLSDMYVRNNNFDHAALFAEAAYRMAVGSDPEIIMAWFVTEIME